MPLFNKKPEPFNRGSFMPPEDRLEFIKQIARERAKQKPEKIPEKMPEEEGFFGGKPYLKRPEAREKFKQASPKIPGSAKWYTREQRKAMVEELFPRKKYGEYLDPREAKKMMKDLTKESWTKKGQERTDLERKLRWLKREMGGQGK